MGDNGDGWEAGCNGSGLVTATGTSATDSSARAGFTILILFRCTRGELELTFRWTYASGTCTMGEDSEGCEGCEG
jgi:hypothetical protein